MKKIKILLGSLAMVLAFGLTVVSCDDGGDDDPPPPERDTALVAKWYMTQEMANSASPGTESYEFKSDGNFNAGGTENVGTWSTSGGKITLYSGGQAMETATYSISGTTLTFINGSLLTGSIYKKAT
jgi:hypothetical protein